MHTLWQMSTLVHVVHTSARHFTSFVLDTTLRQLHAFLFLVPSRGAKLERMSIHHKDAQRDQSVACFTFIMFNIDHGRLKSKRCVDTDLW